MATITVEAIERVAVIDCLFSGVVYAKPLLRPQTGLWPPAALSEGWAHGPNHSAAFFYPRDLAPSSLYSGD